MKYYEKEVLSIPAGKSIAEVEEYNIYMCLDTKNYNYKKSLFVTFRQRKGGEMKKLYKIDDIIILNPSNPNEIEALRNSTYSEDVIDRILSYIKSRPNSGDKGNMRIYVLSKTDSIELPHNPKPQRNNANIAYYSLKEMLSGNEFLTPESQQ